MGKSVASAIGETKLPLTEAITDRPQHNTQLPERMREGRREENKREKNKRRRRRR